MAPPQGHERLTSALRLVLAVAGLAIFLGDPREHPDRRLIAQAVLALFIAYSVVVYAATLRGVRRFAGEAAPWIDVGWITLLVAASAGTSSIFFPLYLFAILSAAFGRGFRMGMAVVVASVLSFAIVGALTAPRGAALDAREFVVRPLYLLVVGYLTAVWGGYEVRSRARLALLRDVTSLSNPRFGIDRTLAQVLERLRAFHEADSCRLVVAEEDGERRWMRAVTRGVAEAPRPIELPAGLAQILLPPPHGAAFLAPAPRRAWSRGETDLEISEPPASRTRAPPEAARALLTALDAGALVSVPFRYHASASGRLYVVRREGRPFDWDDAEFLRHVVDQVAPVLESIRLVDRLASDAADEERRRIARDLHDSVIQPYLGLRLGLTGLRNAVAGGRLDEARGTLERLVELTEAEIETLRGYVRALRNADAGAAGGLLETSLRRFCRRFSEATGIRVDLMTGPAPVENDRLAAEVFQMVAEALSNVRRHSAARRAEVRVATEGERVVLTVTNDGAAGTGAAFFPRSLGERAAALGGEVRVEQREDATTVVRAEIPL
jgi:signal transduction histidine kinase